MVFCLTSENAFSYVACEEAIFNLASGNGFFYVAGENAFSYVASENAIFNLASENVFFI